MADIAEPVGIRRNEPRLDQIVGILGCAAGFPGFETPHSLTESLFERPADSHHFSDAFHLRAEHRLGSGEFFELPSWNLHDDVIDGGFEAGRGLAGDIVLDFVEPVSDSQLRGDLGNRESGRLRGQRRAA